MSLRFAMGVGTDYLYGSSLAEKPRELQTREKPDLKQKQQKPILKKKEPSHV